MNFKKRFENRIEQDKKSMVTESDRAYLSTLQNMVAERPEGEVIAKSFNRKPLIISVACFLVAALTVTLILYYTLYSKPKNIFYLTENYVLVDSDIDELNADLTLFTLEVDTAKYSFKVIRTYDSVSGDTLFYRLDIISQDISLKTQIEIVVNENFIHDDMHYSEETVEGSISGYTINYTQSLSSTSVSGITLNIVDCMGEMQIGTQWIYIQDYRELSFAEGTFVETLQSIIHFK